MINQHIPCIRPRPSEKAEKATETKALSSAPKKEYPEKQQEQPTNSYLKHCELVGRSYTSLDIPSQEGLTVKTRKYPDLYMAKIAHTYHLIL